MSGEHANGGHWSLDDIPFHCIDVTRARSNEELFLLLAGASFVEMASHLYTRNLVEKYRGDAEVSSWLTGQWEPQELQHGRALQAYVNRAWPEFDWRQEFAGFLAEHSRRNTPDVLESSPSLEMAARCVVEMGTSTYYAAIRSISDEPVLARLVRAIQRDEVDHYKHFYRYFHRYNASERNSRTLILGALARRLRVILRSDVERGSWYPYRALHPNATRDGREFRQAVTRTTTLVRRHYPASMAVKMLLKPLALPPTLNRLSHGTVKLAQRLILH